MPRWPLWGGCAVRFRSEATRRRLRLDAFGESAENGEQARDDLVEHGFVDVAGADGVGQRGSVAPARAWHLEIEPGVGGSTGVEQAPPIGDDDAFEPSLAARVVAQQPRLVGAVVAVEPVLQPD